jgi:hypothetical protein
MQNLAGELGYDPRVFRFRAERVTSYTTRQCTLAPRAGLEPAHGLINSQVPSQLGYLGKNPPVKAKAPDLLDPRPCNS